MYHIRNGSAQLSFDILVPIFPIPLLSSMKLSNLVRPFFLILGKEQLIKQFHTPCFNDNTLIGYTTQIIV
ncbi:hypothetical protein NMY3_02774 [Candidatus Nitrosocosmicus oleophilus]|uniref:Uncharacterized protein n=1 Tax=Candidatus Nitrosocosmicus oleophilus TaxID=1353260 RepID=A0A654LZI1_9ARCH|nr:hypothetical protein NMY3_02774 [Candidatus Nitrosocosmicus oleophilus]